METLKHGQPKPKNMSWEEFWNALDHELEQRYEETYQIIKQKDEEIKRLKKQLGTVG